MSIAKANVFVEQFDNDELLDAALEELKEIPDAEFDLLENPFEKKFTLRDTHMLPSSIDLVIRTLEAGGSVRAEKEFGFISIPDLSRHYCSVFKYLPGGFLSCHVDAGIHPLNNLRKHVTAIVYLGETDDGGELELWEGGSAALSNPEIRELHSIIKPEHGKIVLFECNDHAWHSVSKCLGEKPRYAITVSYLSDEVDRWHKRERAFFVPKPDEKWDEETFKIRDTRADAERYAEAYRT